MNTGNNVGGQSGNGQSYADSLISQSQSTEQVAMLCLDICR